jgi:hypothetical protein
MKRLTPSTAQPTNRYLSELISSILCVLASLREPGFASGAVKRFTSLTAQPTTTLLSEPVSVFLCVLASLRETFNAGLSYGVVKQSTPVDAKMTPKHIHVSVLRKALKGRDQAWEQIARKIAHSL